MLTLALYDRLQLRLQPFAQRLIADAFLRFDYRNVELVVEGLDNLPEAPVIFAMNHTDNFNYWPFQYELHRRFRRYTAAWVKGKNYEGRISSLFMRSTNNIPVASTGYLITRDFIDTMGRRPTEEEYRRLRTAVDGQTSIEGDVPDAILARPRQMLGAPIDPARDGYQASVDGVMSAMMRRFVEMNRCALDMKLDLLVFPQGTRSRRLSAGHIGLAQVALHLGATVVPVGCSGSDEIYTSRSIVSKAGRVVYRIGEAIPPGHWDTLEPFEPFTREAERTHGEAFEGATREIMNRIDGLLDEPYRFSEHERSQGTSGTDRFV